MLVLIIQQKACLWKISMFQAMRQKRNAADALMQCPFLAQWLGGTAR